ERSRCARREPRGGWSGGIGAAERAERASSGRAPRGFEHGMTGSLGARRLVLLVQTFLAVVTLVFAFLHLVPGDPVEIMLGESAALRPGSAVDRIARLASLAGACLPGFWLGPLLILLFSLRLGWLPVSGRGGLAHLVLPATTLGLGMLAVLVRLVRASMIGALGEDYVRSARAKGAPERRVIAVHALRNAL